MDNAAPAGATMKFRFGLRETEVFIGEDPPSLESITGGGFPRSLLVCDRNTLPLAEKILSGGGEAPLLVLPHGEESKNQSSLETILKAALAAGLGRDGLIIGCGGGVIGDLAGFAASVYMRGTGFRLVSTTLLGMVDAALGGKTGIDLGGVKNLAGTFYPASRVFAPVGALATLPRREWKSGMAELIKTALLDGTGEILRLLRENRARLGGPPERADPLLRDIVSLAMETKGRIAEADPEETGDRRMLLNLGHSFAHALESAAGLGRLSHGEAVAWGIARAADLGLAKGVTPAARAAEIRELLSFHGFGTGVPHPLGGDRRAFFGALGGDKKNRDGKNVFIVPGGEGAEALPVDLDRGKEKELLERIVFGP